MGRRYAHMYDINKKPTIHRSSGSREPLNIRICLRKRHAMRDRKTDE
jgi:hypothetical protein